MDATDNGRQPLERLLDELGTAWLMDLPMSIYVADTEGNLVYCNAEGRAMLGLPEEGQLSGSICDYHAEPHRHAELVERAAGPREPGARSAHPKDVVKLEVAGRDVFVEHYLGPLRSSAAGSAADRGLYVGCMVDITEDHIAAQRAESLQDTVRELTFDIGQILHANTATLVMVNQTLLAAARALEPELEGNDDATRPEDLAAGMGQMAARLVTALGRMLEAGDPDRRANALPDDRWEKLERLVPMLANYEENIPVPEMRISALRAITSEVLGAIRAMEPGHMPKEVVRDTVRAAEDLERRTCFMDTLATRTAVIQMDTSLAALRDFITAEIRTDDPSQRFTVASIIRESIAHLAEFSRAARVEVVWKNRSEDVEVFGNRRDLLRAITNLLHNAIKYSWKREGYDAPWISIEVFEGENEVSIQIENWGVPVEQAEVEAGLVFGMGYRGKRSKDRGRLGTGIGLTDSQRVANAHRGSLTISSKPARGSSRDPGERDYYRQPFLTRVRMTLPLAV